MLLSHRADGSYRASHLGADAVAPFWGTVVWLLSACCSAALLLMSFVSSSALPWGVALTPLWFGLAAAAMLLSRAACKDGHVDGAGLKHDRQAAQNRTKLRTRLCLVAAQAVFYVLVSVCAQRHSQRDSVSEEFLFLDTLVILSAVGSYLLSRGICCKSGDGKPRSSHDSEETASPGMLGQTDKRDEERLEKAWAAGAYVSNGLLGCTVLACIQGRFGVCSSAWFGWLICVLCALGLLGMFSYWRALSEGLARRQRRVNPVSGTAGQDGRAAEREHRLAAMGVDGTLAGRVDRMTAAGMAVKGAVGKAPVLGSYHSFGMVQEPFEATSPAAEIISKGSTGGGSRPPTAECPSPLILKEVDGAMREDCAFGQVNRELASGPQTGVAARAAESRWADARRRFSHDAAGSRGVRKELLVSPAVAPVKLQGAHGGEGGACVAGLTLQSCTSLDALPAAPLPPPGVSIDRSRTEQSLHPDCKHPDCKHPDLHHKCLDRPFTWQHSPSALLEGAMQRVGQEQAGPPRHESMATFGSDEWEGALDMVSLQSVSFVMMDGEGGEGRQQDERAVPRPAQLPPPKPRLGRSQTAFVELEEEENVRFRAKPLEGLASAAGAVVGRMRRGSSALLGRDGRLAAPSPRRLETTEPSDRCSAGEADEHDLLVR